MKIVMFMKLSLIYLAVFTICATHKMLKTSENLKTATKAEPSAKPAAAAPQTKSVTPAPTPAAAAPSKPVKKTKAKGGSSGASLSNTNVIPNKPNSTNAVGFVGPATNYTISSPPYILKSCDQIILFPAKILTDFDDFTKKKSAFFTLSIYMLNMFDSPTSNKLSLSILINNINQLPFLLTGSKTCISINDSKNSKTIGLCLPDKDRMNEIIKVFQDFQRCRAGDDLKPISIDTIKKLIKLNNCTETINNVTLAKPNLNFDQYVVKKDYDYGKWKPVFLTPVPGSVEQ